MRSYKSLLNSMSKNGGLRELTEDESRKLKEVYLEAYSDLAECCEKFGLTVMLVGGSALGAVRHRGFIPWDDDLDVAMPRKDFELLKSIFEKELGDKYILASPNYRGNAVNRFPMMLVKNTKLVDIQRANNNDYSNIKIDIFLIDNIPNNKVIRLLKGLLCTSLMFMASLEESYEKQNKYLKNYMYRTKNGRRVYNFRIGLGRLFSFFNFQKWMDIVDKSLVYNKETRYMGIPSGRAHYFGEIRPKSTFLPASKGSFEGLTVKLPRNPQDYLNNLYGADYMTLPPEEKRERHFILDINFKES